MIDATTVADIYTQFVAQRTCGRQAGALTALTLPFSYPDGDAIEVYFRDMPGDMLTITDYGHTFSFLSDYGALDVRPRHVVGVVKELCSRYEAQFVNGEVQVLVPTTSVGEGLCCITEAIQAVAGMMVLADVLHAGGGGGKRVVTRLKTRLNEAGLVDIHRKTPLKVPGKSTVHDVRFAYPDNSVLILTQSLKTDPEHKASQIAFDSADIARGYSEDRRSEPPDLICVYQSPNGSNNGAEMTNVLNILRSWFKHVFDVETDAEQLVKQIRSDVTEINGSRLFPDS